MSAPRFGAWLTESLKEKRYSQETLARKMREHLASELGIEMRMNPANISYFEQGRVPSWPVLQAMAVALKEDPWEMAGRLFAALQLPNGRDLVPHGTDHASVEVGALNADAATPRLLEKRDARIRDLEARLATAQSIAVSLIDALTDGDKGGEAPAIEPKRGRRR